MAKQIQSATKRTYTGNRGEYALSEAQVETLALKRTRNLLDCDQADGMYLRALVYHTQGKFGAAHGKRPATESQLDALELVAQPLYEAVLRGVTTPDIAIEGGIEHNELTRRTRERNRRATFARTAKAALVAWCEAGGDIRKLDVGTVTKSELRTSVAARRNPAVGVERAIERAQRRIVASVTAQARASPGPARAALAAVIEELQEVLDGLPEDGQGVGAQVPTERYLSGLAAKIVARVGAAKTKTESTRLLEAVINPLMEGVKTLGVPVSMVLSKTGAHRMDGLVKRSVVAQRARELAASKQMRV